MARPRNNEKHIALAVEGLVASIQSLVQTITTAARSASPAAASAPAHAKVPGQRGPGKNNPKLKAAIKASWARMSAAEKKARIRKMLAGRGLKPKKG